MRKSGADENEPIQPAGEHAADLAEVRHSLEDRTVPHARQALDDPDLPVDIQLRPDRTRSGGRGLR